MTSTPKSTTTSVEPWSGSKQYLTDVYSQFNDLIQNGAPQAYQGSTVADQSQQTKDALAGAENIARNGDTSVLTNATNGVNSVLNSTPNSGAINTLTNLQNTSTLGTNPTNAIASQIANGGASSGQSWTNAAAGNAAGLQNYNNSAISSIASMLGQTNPALSGAQALTGYTNGAVNQAQNYNQYQNAALGAQQAQANQLATSSNPAATDYLKSTASGANIGNNPYLSANIASQQANIADQLKSVTNPGIDSQAAALGRTGSGAYATQRNNAESTAAKAMSDVAVNALTNQYNTDVQAQQNAANLYGNLYNSDQANQLNANQALSNTSNSQQSQALAGTQLYGQLSDAQQAAQLAANQNYGNISNAQQTQNLNAANSLSSANDSQQAANLAANQNYANILANQNSAQQTALQNDRNYQLSGLSQLGSNYQNNISNMLGLNNQALTAANSQLTAQQNANSQTLNAANLASTVYGNQYLPSQQLANVGSTQDAYNSAVLQGQISQWDQQQQQPLQNLANFANILNGGNYTSTTTPVYSNSTGQILGGLSSLAGLFALSDSRTKILHKFVGKMPLVNGDSLAIYEWSYIDDPEAKHWIGPVAQEVERKTDACVEIDGLKYINVSQLIGESA